MYESLEVGQVRNEKTGLFESANQGDNSTVVKRGSTSKAQTLKTLKRYIFEKAV